MKRLAVLFTVLGPIFFVTAFYFMMRPHPEGEPPDGIVILAPLLVIGVIFAFMGPVFFTFHFPLEKRKKIATVILVVALALMAIGYYLAHQEYLKYGEDKEKYSNSGLVQLVIGVLLFSFSYLTLLLKNKYDRWKIYTRSKRDAFLLSLADSLGFSALFLGLLFRLVHWPGANVMGIFGVIFIVAGMFAWNQRMKKEVVYRKETEDKLQDSYRQIEEKNKEITDSITYAKRIQHSLLAHDELLLKGLGEHFVLYLPKDIVSGDFYWATATSDSFYLAVCDSTGHGVPGAFMSLLNTTFLNEAITEKKIADPNLIFEHVRKQLIANISQQGGQDGMDGILLRIEKKSGAITYTGANNAPIVVRNGQVIDCASDKMPVGIGERMEPYELHKLAVGKGDAIFLATDGYADQFGGARGKKMKRSGLKTLLSQHAHLEASEQQNQLESAFFNWRGSLEQLDDVCIIGIRIQ